MNILITGASGFIGVNFDKVNQDICFKKVIRRESKSNVLALDSSIFWIDFLDENTSWDGAFDNIDAIIHLAGLAHNSSYTDDDYKRVNVEGTLHLANEAIKAGVKRFVFVSSIGVNGIKTDSIPFSFDSPEKPHNTYSKSKYKAEIGLKKIARNTGLELVIVRPPLVYGASAPGNFRSLVNLIKKVPVLPFGIVNNKRDFIAVENLVDLLIVCAKHPHASGHIFLASDGETVSIKEFTNIIAYALNRKIYQLPIPIFLMRWIGVLMNQSSVVAQLLSDLQVDSSNVYDVLNWTPPYTMKQALIKLQGDKKND